MALVLDQDQTLLVKAAKDFVASTAPLRRLRALRDAGDTLGYSPEVWQKMVELGWTAMPFSEADGGLGLGLAEAVLVTEELGRQLAPEPFVPCVILAGSCLALQGSLAQKERWLAPMIAGTSRLALAHEEAGSRSDLRLCRTIAERVGPGFRLSGKKAPVLGAVGASALLVVARTGGQERDAQGLGIFLVEAGAPGLEVKALRRVDSQNAAEVTLDGVVAEPVGAVGEALAVLEQSVDRATVALAGEMLGGMGGALERTLQYLREREQFGVKIGSFQVLQHRAARLFIEVELDRSAVMAAARAVDAGAPEAREYVSVAKARCSDGYVLVANEAIQMHGGIGMTDEHDIGFFVKRAKCAELTHGDAAFHRHRYAALKGF